MGMRNETMYNMEWILLKQAPAKLGGEELMETVESNEIFKLHVNCSVFSVQLVFF